MERPDRNPGRGTRGSMLIVAMGILALMSIMAVTFARLMKLEMDASANYVDMIRAKQLAESGLARAAAEVRESSAKRSFDSVLDPWVFKDKKGKLATGITIEEAQRYSVSGSLGAAKPGGVDRYRVKIIDCASQINLNVEKTVLALPQMLDNLGQAIAELNNVSNPVSGLQHQGRTGGDAILSFRDSLLGKKFSSKMQLLEFFVESERKKYTPDADKVALEKFNQFKDYVTAHSWMNEKTVKGMCVKEPLGVERYQIEPRAPINVNTASEPVLVACLQGIGGRGRYVGPTIDKSETVADYPVEGGELPTGEEKELTEDLKFIYVWPLNKRQAKGIAAHIVRWRRNKPFKSFADFEYFVDKEISSSSIPTYPDRQPSDDRNFPHFKAWYEQAARDMIKANFNPNARHSRYNPSKGIRLIVDKVNLCRPGEDKFPKNAYTTEFCFSSMGYFEIISLGQVVAANGEVVAESKLRAVAKIFDTIMHTTQKEFDLALKDDKREITSYPWNTRAQEQEGEPRIGYFELRPISPVEDALCVVRAASHKLLDVSFDQEKYNEMGETSEIAIANGDKSTAMNEKPDANDTSSEGFESGFKFGLFPKYSDVLPDGFFTSKFKKVTRWPPILRYRAAAVGLDLEKGEFSNPKVDGIGQGDVNIPMFTGALEFWIKPQFDSEAKVFSGFLGVTTYTERECGPVGDKRKYKGGTQMYFFMNTQGKLRVSRMYYEAFYDESGTLFPGAPTSNHVNDFDEVNPNPASFPPYEDDRKYLPDLLATPEKERENPIGRPLPMDADMLQPKRARVDIVVDPDEWGGWKAGEWHHVVIAWDDEVSETSPAMAERGNACLNLAIDGDWLPSQVYQCGIGKMVLLNEINPIDSIYLGGIFRRRKYEPLGMFKFGGKELRVVANATIDNFVTYKQNNIRINKPDRYPTSGKYGNYMTIPFPPGVEKVKIRAVDYIAYAPTSFIDRERRKQVPWPLVNPLKPSEIAGMTLSRGVVPGVVVRLFRADSKTSTIHPGEQVKRDRITGSARIGYEVRLRALYTKGGRANIASPAFDTILVSYFLPREEILVLEKVVE